MLTAGGRPAVDRGLGGQRATSSGCFNCGKEGHQARFCPDKSAAARSQAATTKQVYLDPPIFDDVDYDESQELEYADDDGSYPDEEYDYEAAEYDDGEEYPPDDYYDEGYPVDADQDEETEPPFVPVTHITATINSLEAIRPSLIGPTLKVPCEVEGVPMHCLLDSGSAVSIMSDKVCHRIATEKTNPQSEWWDKARPLDPNAFTLKDYSGNIIHAAQFYPVTIAVAGKSVEIPVIVNPASQSDDLLLGTNFMCQAGYILRSLNAMQCWTLVPSKLTTRDLAPTPASHKRQRYQQVADNELTSTPSPSTTPTPPGGSGSLEMERPKRRYAQMAKGQAVDDPQSFARSYDTVAKGNRARWQPKPQGAAPQSPTPTARPEAAHHSPPIW